MATKSGTPKKSTKAKISAPKDEALNAEMSDLSEKSLAETDSEQIQLQGRGAFIVEVTTAGVAVASTVVTEDGRALAMPAIFPNLTYALSQIDEMRALVIRHFDQATQIGTKVMAEQIAQNKSNLKLAKEE